MLKVVSWKDSISYRYNNRETVKHRYTCVCDCGKTSVSFKDSLLKGGSKSCGCQRGAKTNRKRNHNYDMWLNAKTRARLAGLEFNLELDDLQVPDVCPVFGTNLIRGTGKRTSDSPSLDRIDNTKGYTKDNIWIISYRANEMKNRYSLDDLEKLVIALKQVWPDGREEKR